MQHYAPSFVASTMASIHPSTQMVAAFIVLERHRTACVPGYDTLIKGAPPIAADPGGFPDFSENVDFWNFPVGFGVWEGLQSMGNGCGLQMDGFSARFEPSESISIDFHDFIHFGIVCGGLMLFPEGPRTL